MSHTEGQGTAQDEAPLLEVHNLVTEFRTPGGTGAAVNGLSFHVRRGETLGIVGESGCGKSITALSLLRLIPSPPGEVTAGQAWFNQLDLLALSDKEIRGVRGNDIAMIFQEPMTSLNPVLTIGYQIAEAVRKHTGASKTQARERAVEMLDLVRIPEPERRAREFPHQLSGGMRQRAMIAMALSCDPQLVIADEPTTALDVTIQAQVLGLMNDLQAQLGMAIMLITHDLGVIAETAHRVIVMYAGEKIEEADVGSLFAAPQHPYTRGLLASVPRLGASVDGASERLTEIPGIVPALNDRPPGCAFAPRCHRASEQCRQHAPELAAHSADHQVACWHPGETL
ncbi:MAG: ABC transporter ATP-binding protein [Pseudomonadota bacterium]